MRVLIVQCSLSPPGGGNAVAAWMVHALAGHHDVGTLTLRPWSTTETNAFYGTAIPEHGIVKHVAPAPWGWLPNEGLFQLRMSTLLRSARTLASRYDLMITADNFAVFERPGLQYMHYPMHLRPQPSGWPAIVPAYFALCEQLMGARWTDAARNHTLANSQWTANGLSRLGEAGRISVLYPPVIDPGMGLPWIDRDDVFLCVGRFTPSKRLKTAIAIVARVRERALPHARLVIVGSNVDPQYTDRIHGLAAREGNWIEFREDLPREALNALMGRSRYGIQPMEGEHFGMATAEMTRAGCLVFAHNSGGSPEVLGSESALLWNSEDESVRKICDLVATNVDDLRARLREHTDQFSTESFVARFRSLIQGVGTL